MRRNCNLELRLLPSAYYSNSLVDSSGSDSDQSHHQNMRRAIMEESNTTSSGISPKQNQPLTIFYNGKICVCDVNEFQARAILLLLNKETDEKVKTPTVAAVAGRTDPSSPTVQSPVYSPTAAISMKRSLQRFLQKRKHRAQAMTPYNHR